MSKSTFQKDRKKSHDKWVKAVTEDLGAPLTNHNQGQLGRVCYYEAFSAGALWLADQLRHEDLTFGDGSKSRCECFCCWKINKVIE